jgi:selenocysteine lyase/cysteine desulfurase
MLDKQFFPTLVNNPNLAYFDNAASTQTHVQVLNVMQRYYTHYRSNAGRGEYGIADKATTEIENARDSVANLLNVSSSHILFTSGATEALNMIAEWCKSYTTVILTEAEHNANIVPWLEKGFNQDKGNLIVIPIVDMDGSINIDVLEKQLSQLTSNCLFSFCATSNVTGVTQDWEMIATMCHKYGVSVAIDFSQTVAHDQIDLTNTPVEWAVFSAHKMYGPTGVGVLYSAFDFADLKPIKFGGGAVTHVAFNGAQYHSDAEKHSPGTPNIAGIIGMGVAAELLTYMGFDKIKQEQTRVVDELFAKGIDCIPGCDLYPTLASDRSIFSLVPRKAHSSDIATLLAQTDVAVRTGRVCAHPLVDRISGGKGIVRVSIAPYNTAQDVDRLVSELNKAFSFFS